MAKPKTESKEPVRHGTIADLSEEALQARILLITGKLAEIDALLDDAVELTDEQRLVAHRMRGPAEQEALASVLDYADSNVAAFKGLANKDGGHDPSKFETDLLRHRLAVAGLLGKLAERFDETRLAVSDSALFATTLVKPAVLAAYEIAKPLAKHDDTHGKKLNPALNYYGGMARTAVKTRKSRSAPPQ